MAAQVELVVSTEEKRHVQYIDGHECKDVVVYRNKFIKC
jgi:hypothetical protein